jgi:hypothetical protein
MPATAAYFANSSAGDVRDLYSAEDVDTIHENMKNYAKDSGHESDRDTCFRLFKEKVRKVRNRSKDLGCGQGW